VNPRLLNGLRNQYFKHPFLYNFGFLFFLNLWFSLHDRSSPIFNGVNALSTPAQAEQAWGMSDAGSYLKMGMAQAKFGDLPPDLLWAAGFWPPGMSYLHKYSINIVGSNGSFILVLATITALLWASVLSFLLKIFQKFMGWWIATAMIFAIIQTDFYHEYLVRDAIIWSDGYTSGLMCLTIIFSYLGSKNSKFFCYVASGISLAAVIYMRGQYFASLKILGAFTILIGIVLLVIRLFNSIHPSENSKSNQRYVFLKVFVPLLLTTAISLSACAPYLLWREDKFGDISWDLSGKWHWTNGEAFAYYSNWQMQKDISGFAWEGGAGTACKVDEILCRTVNRIEGSSPGAFIIYDETPFSSRDFYEMTKSTFLNHPIKWFTIKFPFFIRYWISGPALATPGPSNILFAAFSAVGLGILLVLPLFKYMRRNQLIPILLSMILVGLTLLPPYIGHLEVRYLFPAKVIGIVVFVGLFGTFANYLTKKFVKSSGTG
jgi:hypothetical protein